MKEIDFMTTLHKSTKRDYLARVNDKEFPKAKAALLAKKWGYDYWDGDRKINYGGYKYIKDRWKGVIENIIKFYKLPPNAKILDIGCGKGYFLYDFLKTSPLIEIYGIDISEYAIQNSKPEVKKNLIIGNANHLPWEKDFFDLVVSFNTFHNFYNFDLEVSLKEMERVGKEKYLCVESYRNEEEKANLLYWQVTCEAFNTPDEWKWWFKKTGYNGEYSFIYFE